MAARVRIPLPSILANAHQDSPEHPARPISTIASRILVTAVPASMAKIHLVAVAFLVSLVDYVRRRLTSARAIHANSADVARTA